MTPEQIDHIATALITIWGTVAADVARDGLDDHDLSSLDQEVVRLIGRVPTADERKAVEAELARRGEELLAEIGG